MRVLVATQLAGSYSKIAGEIIPRLVSSNIDVMVVSIPPSILPLQWKVGDLCYCVKGKNVKFVFNIRRREDLQAITAFHPDAVLNIYEPTMLVLKDILFAASTLKDTAVREGAPFIGYFTLDHYPLRGRGQAQILDNLFDFVIPVTSYEGRLARERLSRCKVVEPVPYGVDHAVYNPSAWSASPMGRKLKEVREFKVIYVGTGSPYKDPGRWYRVVGEVARRGVPVRGVLKLSTAVGTSDMPADVSVLEDVNQLAGKIEYVLGWLDDRELAALVSACDVFLTLSTAEGFCLAALEAQACGLPVVLPDIPQLREVYGDSALYVKREGTWYSGLGGFYVTSSVEDAVEKLVLLYEDAGFRKEMQARSLANAKRYSWDESAAKIIKILESVAGRR